MKSIFFPSVGHSDDLVVVVFGVIWHQAWLVIQAEVFELQSRSIISRYGSLTFPVSSRCRHAELPSFSVLIIMQIFDYLLRKITASSFTDAACLSPVYILKENSS